MTRYDAFLNRCLLRLFDDSPGLTSYLDRSEVDGETLMVVFNDLPAEVIVRLPPAFGVSKVRAFKFSEDGSVKVAFILLPSEEELKDFSAFPKSSPAEAEPAEDSTKDTKKNVSPTRVKTAANDKGIGKQLYSAPSGT